LACVAVVVIALWILSGYAGSHTSATSGDTQVSLIGDFEERPA